MKISASRVAHDLNSQIMILLNSLDRMATSFPDDEEAALALRAAKECASLAAELLPAQAKRRAENATVKRADPRDRKLVR